MRNFEFCKYTFIHRKVLVALAEKLIKEEDVKEVVLKRLELHDMDKLTLYLLRDKPVVKKYHIETKKHKEWQ